jgi:hypothetical protein
MRVRSAAACAVLAAVGSFGGCAGDAAPSSELTVALAPTPPPAPATKAKGARARVKLMPSAPAGALPKPAN